MRTLFCTVWLILLVAAAPAYCAPDDAWSIDALMRELRHADRTQAQFTERKYVKVLKAPLESSGLLIYEAPDRMIKRTLQPKPETMTVDADKLTLERQGRSRSLRLQDYPTVWAFIESIRSTLKGDLAALERFYAVALSGDKHRWSLAMTPKDPKMKRVISSVEITGTQGKIRTVKVEEAQGDRSVMTITEQE
jgi:hypothetical protein